MNIEILRRIRIERYIFAGLMAFLMIAIAEISGEKEIIFPEICALTIGAWISEQQPWMCNKRKMFFLVSIAALFGMLVTKYIDIPLIFQVALCFGFTGVILTIARTTLIPIISACILPVYLGTKSWIYPISVTIMALIIQLFFCRWFFGHFYFLQKFALTLVIFFLRFNNRSLFFFVIIILFARSKNVQRTTDKKKIE